MAIEFQSKTPFNTNKNKIKLLIGCLDFSQLTGMPMYIYNLSKELIKNYNYHITIVAKEVGGDIRGMANAKGIECYRFQDLPDREYDIMFLHEYVSRWLLNRFPTIPAWNYCHSMLDLDRPIDKTSQIRGHLAPRDQVADYWKKRLGIKFQIIPIPIDREKFYPIKMPKPIKGNTYNILAVCTLDPLRKPMLLNLIKRAKKDKNVKVVIVGKDHGALENVKLPKNVLILPPDPNIQKYIIGCDEMAGIYVGTVTLEAWAMGKKCSVYDEHGNFKLMEKPKDFEQTYDSKIIARQYHKLFNEKWADIIIPHYDQRELLSQTLQSIPLRNYNVVITRGGTFAENCNKGALAAKTDKLIFANDDLIINPEILWELVDHKAEIVGVRQFYPNGQPLCLGIKIDRNFRYYTTNKLSEAIYPSGAFFKINRDIWNDLGGFDESFKNGGEDQDLFLKAIEKDYTINFAEGSVIHYLSQSKGRFDDIEWNDKYFYSKWPQMRLARILHKLKKK